MTDDIRDVDLLAFERGDAAARRAAVDGTIRSLATGFVYTRHDIPADVLDRAYGALAEFFALSDADKRRYVAEGTHGQAGYTPALVETAAANDVPDWKEMLNWGAPRPAGHPLRTRYPHRYADPVFPDDVVPGIGSALTALHERLLDLQRRFLRIIAVGIGCADTFFDEMLDDGPTLSRAIHYPPMQRAPSGVHTWAAEHGDINLITALPRATAPGLEVRTESGWIDAAPPEDSAIINTGIMLEHLTNGAIPTGRHRVVCRAAQGEDRYSVVQFCHPSPWTVLAPVPSCVTVERPAAFTPIEAGELLDQVLRAIRMY